MKVNHRVTMFFVSVLLGAMLTVQFTALNRPKAEDVEPYVDNLQLTAELSQERERNRYFESDLKRLENQIRMFESKSDNHAAIAKAIEDELAKTKRLAGTTDMVSNGLLITIEPPSNASLAVGTATYPMLLGELLYQLCQTLNSNGAQAVAVENHRLTSLSSIRTISEVITNVNRTAINTQTITIKAIGNIEQMKIGLNTMKPTFIEYLGKEIKAQEVTNGALKVPAYDKPVDFTYAKPEGDKNL